jgi:hypothetical protein
VNVVLGIVTVVGFTLPFAIAGGLSAPAAIPVSRRIRGSRRRARNAAPRDDEISAVDDRDHGE